MFYSNSRIEISMNVLLILPYTTTRIFGGPEGVAYDTIEGFKKKNQVLQRNDLSICVLSPVNTIEETQNDMDLSSNIKIHYFKKIRPTSLTSDIHFGYHLLKRRAQTDLIHSHSPYGAFAATYLGLPTMFTLHGMFWKEQQFSQNLYTKMPYKIHTMRFKAFINKLKTLIAISPYVIHEIKQNIQFNDVDIELIENPVSDVFFKIKKSEIEGLIFSPGAIASRKNQIEQIKALSLMKKSGLDFTLVLTGKIFDSAYLRQLKKEINDLNLKKNVHILGEVPFEQLLQYYAEASIVTLSSKQETAPMVVSEGMATGTPIIASNIAGIPYMITDTETGFLVDPLNCREMAENLIQLTDDKGLRKRIGEKARKEAENRWKSELIAQKLIYLYLNHN